MAALAAPAAEPVFQETQEHTLTVQTITSSGYYCGVTGGQPICNANCIGCRGCCSHVALAPAGSITGCVVAQGGFGGFWMCNTGTAMYCCFAANGWCGTNYSGAGCGFICNFGITAMGQGTITAACACGGTCNISGGISCVDFCNCTTSDSLSYSRFYHTFPACDTRQAGTVQVCYCATTQSNYTRGEAAFEMAYFQLYGGGSPIRAYTWSNGCYVDCGCYGQSCFVCGIVGAGYGSQGAVSGGITNTCCGSFGGPGLVKITWVSS